MKACEWEERVALYAGGDSEEPAAVEAHVAGCSGCAGLLAALEADREMLRMPPAGLPSVRVEAVLEQARRRRGYWMAAAAAAAVVVVGLSGWMWWTMQAVPEPPVVAGGGAVRARPPIARPVENRRQVESLPHKTRRRQVDPAIVAAIRKALAPPPVEMNGYLVKTKDPEVVFLLVPETKNGDSDD